MDESVYDRRLFHSTKLNFLRVYTYPNMSVGERGEITI